MKFLRSTATAKASERTCIAPVRNNDPTEKALESVECRGFSRIHCELNDVAGKKRQPLNADALREQVLSRLVPRFGPSSGNSHPKGGDNRVLLAYRQIANERVLQKQRDSVSHAAKSDPALRSLRCNAAEFESVVPHGVRIVVQLLCYKKFRMFLRDVLEQLGVVIIE